jgi:hypothetical protein
MLSLRFTGAWLALIFAAFNTNGAVQILSTNTIHLGVRGKPEWDIFENQTPDGEELVFSFEGKATDHESTLLIRQDDVKQEWSVTLNKKSIGNLFLMEADLIRALAIPAGTLREGKNELRIYTKTAEDILIREIALADLPKTNLFNDCTLDVQVRDSDSKQNLPCRLTLLDSNGSLAALTDFAVTNHLVSRPGVVYTSDGSARIGLLPGKYIVYATRGSEYSLARTNVELAASSTNKIALALNREVKTSGWVASDTHVHTLTFSHHGDSTVDERVITLAGEAIELPVATDHNQHADFSPAIRKHALSQYFTLVNGNEVTTEKGHFNIFPVSLSDPPANSKITDWPELMKNIHIDPEVKVVILNHPTDTHSGFTPFATSNFNRITGKNLRGPDFTFDAMEVINSGAMRSDWMEPFRCWFALLNRGYKITAVGSSDCHDVSRFIVGQGRTYIRADDSDVSKIDIDKVCKNLRAGKAAVSLGLFPQITINAVAGPGDMFSVKGDSIDIAATVDCPQWMRAEKVELFANGNKIKEEKFPSQRKPGDPFRFNWIIPKPKHDFALVLIASGNGMTAPYWAVARPYQPNRKHFEQPVIGATNPVWIDADEDGKYTSPRAYAKKLVFTSDESAFPKVIEALGDFDWATGAQAAEILHDKGLDLTRANVQEILQGAAPQTKQAFKDYFESIKN